LILFRAIGLDESHGEEEPRHFGTIYHFILGGIHLVIVKINIDAFLGEVLIELLIDELI
jgi:hypothetical protein